MVGVAGDVTMLRAIEAKIRQPALSTLVLPSGTRVAPNGARQPSISGWVANGPGLRAASVAHGFPEVLAEIVQPNAGTAITEDRQAVEGAAQPINGPTTFIVIAQLRSAFAARFLLAAGQHQSRVGVDFIDP